MHRRQERPNTELTFGKWIRRLRGALDLTQEALAEAIPCAVQTIRAIESGARRPSLEMTTRLADVLQVPEHERPHFLSLARQQKQTAAQPPRPAPAAPAPAPATVQPMAARPELPLTALIGRTAERTELDSLLAGGARLVTLVGPGGIGKSRLALQIAHDRADRYPGGALWLSLAAVDRAAAIPLLVADALGVVPDGALAPAAKLDVLLADRQCLLVLDNFEHLLDGDDGDAAIALLDHLLRHATGVQVLITSRERLRLPGEHVFELAGLATPAPDITPEDLVEYGAVQLFVERARQVDRQFVLAPENQQDVARICTLLQGMPLALELAATWARLLTPNEIAAEIAQGIDFLTLSDRSLEVRHRSMRAVFDHSWALLQPDEQRGLARLAVFRGGFDRAAAQAVADMRLPLLAALVDKSLVRSDTVGGAENAGRAIRYDLHELLRQYLTDRLAETGETGMIQARHAVYFGEQIAAITPRLTESDSRPWVERLTAEQGNLTAALSWSLKQGHDRALGVRIAAGLGRYWYLTDQWREGRAWLEMALPYADGQPAAHARIATRLAEICLSLSDLAAGQTYFDAAIALWRELGEESELAWALFQAGSLATATGRNAQAAACFDESLAIYRATGDQGRVAMVLMHRASESIAVGRYTEASAMADECLPIFGQGRYSGSMLAALNIKGRAQLGLGDFDQAVGFFQEALEISQLRNSQSGQAWSLLNLGLAHTLHGDRAVGARFYVVALADYLALDRRGGVLATLDGLAANMAPGAHAADAVRILAATERLRTAIGEQLTLQEVEMRDAALAASRIRLDDTAWTAAWAQGAAMTLDQAVALARHHQPR